MRLLIGCLTCFFAGCAVPISGGADNGKFVGQVVAQWLDDGRKMKLVEPFGYIDPTGLSWDAPIGSVVDGASIPQVAWSVIGGPFEGKYRNASVIHDVACEQQLRPWPDVHRNFYYGMLASGVDENLAKVMYGAVYQFGPRWSLSVRKVVRLRDVDLALSRFRSLAKSGEVVATYMTPIPRGTMCDAGDRKLSTLTAGGNSGIAPYLAPAREAITADASLFPRLFNAATAGMCLAEGRALPCSQL